MIDETTSTEEPENTEPVTAEVKPEVKPEQTFSAEDITKALEKARSEEREKLYDSIASLKEQLKTRDETLNMTAKELEDFKNKNLTTEEQNLLKLRKMEEDYANVRKNLEKVVNTSSQEIQTLRLDLAKRDILSTYKDEIIPELVSGKTIEEIKESAEVSHEKYLMIFDKGREKKTEITRQKPVGTQIAPSNQTEGTTTLENAVENAKSMEDLEKTLQKALQQYGL